MFEPLPSAPSIAYHPATYRGRVGNYSGSIDEVRWGYYKGWSHGQVRRALVRKRWFQVTLHDETHTLVVRIQDNGTSGTGRVILLDRVSGDVSSRSQLAAPLRTLVVGPDAGMGTAAFLNAGTADLRLARGKGASAWRLQGSWGGVQLDLRLDAKPAPTPSLVIGEAREPFTHRPGLTQRAALLHVSGSALVDGVTMNVDGGRAEVVYTNVFLPPLSRQLVVTASGLLPDDEEAACAFTAGNLLGEFQESTVFAGGVPRDAGSVALVAGSDRWTVLSDEIDLQFVPAADCWASESRMMGRVHHESQWWAGELRGTLRGSEICWPALAQSHRLLR